MKTWICTNCGHAELELSGGIYPPKGWRLLIGQDLCPDCQKEPT